MFKRNETTLSLVDEILNIDGVPESAIMKLKELQVILKGLNTKYSPNPYPLNALKSLPTLVRLKKPTFEDDWTEEGMIGYLTEIRWKASVDCYELSFEFGDFFDYNMGFLKECYYPNRDTRKGVAEGTLKEKELYTALEAGMVKSTLTTYYSPMVKGRVIDYRDDIGCLKSLLDELLEPIIELAE